MLVNFVDAKQGMLRKLDIDEGMSYEKFRELAKNKGLESFPEGVVYEDRFRSRVNIVNEDDWRSCIKHFKEWMQGLTESQAPLSLFRKAWLSNVWLPKRNTSVINNCLGLDEIRESSSKMLESISTLLAEKESICSRSISKVNEDDISTLCADVHIRRSMVKPSFDERKLFDELDVARYEEFADVATSFPKFTWDSRIIDSSVEQRSLYKAHIAEILLPPDAREFYEVVDTSTKPKLLKFKSGKVRVKGNIDTLISTSQIIPQPNAIMGLEMKKAVTSSDFHQAMAQLLALDADTNGPVIVVLTDLNDTWHLLWLGKEAGLPCIFCCQLSCIHALRVLRIHIAINNRLKRGLKPERPNHSIFWPSKLEYLRAPDSSWRASRFSGFGRRGSAGGGGAGGGGAAWDRDGDGAEDIEREDAFDEDPSYDASMPSNMHNFS
ncbi:hypothetical protein HK101_003617, partial [Irineochytrium annulatum]